MNEWKNERSLFFAKYLWLYHANIIQIRDYLSKENIGHEKGTISFYFWLMLFCKLHRNRNLISIYTFCEVPKQAQFYKLWFLPMLRFLWLLIGSIKLH